MEQKKNDKANVDKRAGLFTDIGIVAALLLCITAFTWEKKETVLNTLANNIEFDEEEEIADITKEEKKPPPPPPPPVIEVVEDDEIIEEEQPELDEVDVEEDFEVDIPEPDVEEEVAEEPVFTVVEDMPLFPGGQGAMMTFIKKNLQYPEMERENNIEGKAIVQFVVDKAGNVTKVQIYPGTESKGTESMRKEAIRVVNMMPKWKPGKQQGKPVKVKYTLPITFRLR